MHKLVIFCAPGFLKKTGYYFRCLRDKANFEEVGYDVELVVFKPFNFASKAQPDIKIINVFTLLKYRKNFHVYFAENISMIMPLLILKSFFRVKAKYGFVYHGSLHELKFDRFGYIKKRLYKYFEKYADNNLDFVFLISASFKRILNKERLFRDIPTYITPNLPDKKFVDNLKNSKRKQNHDEKIILTYLGNTQAWQNIDYILQTFKKLSRLDKRLNLQLITSEPIKMGELVSKYSLEVDTFEVFTVKNEEVPYYLINSDCLLIVRDINDTNRASCPTKAIEYLMSGTKILVSEELGDISELVESYCLGYVIKEHEKEDIELIYNKILSFKGNKNNPIVPELSVDKNISAYKSV